MIPKLFRIPLNKLPTGLGRRKHDYEENHVLCVRAGLPLCDRCRELNKFPDMGHGSRNLNL